MVKFVAFLPCVKTNWIPRTRVKTLCCESDQTSDVKIFKMIKYQTNEQITQQ